MSLSTTAIASRPGLTIQVDRVNSIGAVGIPALLLDCSRVEVQLGVTEEFATGERIVVRLHDETSRLQLDVSGTVQYQRQGSDDLWHIGCRFTQELDWETLGELFLCGILQTTPRPPITSSPPLAVAQRTV
jgi:hypothetical protein